ncbi:Lacal_2735 family protein [Cryomorphaceae bacterium 1068]|nr:Lacal_2735 family protein [Cryomorphaceae bacterium 1068]
MFGLFKKKSPIEKLYAKHKKLLEKSHQLSHSNRAESDKLQAEAQEVLKEIDELKSKGE